MTHSNAADCARVHACASAWCSAWGPYGQRWARFKSAETGGRLPPECLAKKRKGFEPSDLPGLSRARGCPASQVEPSPYLDMDAAARSRAPRGSNSEYSVREEPWTSKRAWVFKFQPSRGGGEAPPPPRVERIDVGGSKGRAEGASQDVGCAWSGSERRPSL